MREMALCPDCNAVVRIAGATKFGLVYELLMYVVALILFIAFRHDFYLDMTIAALLAFILCCLSLLLLRVERVAS